MTLLQVIASSTWFQAYIIGIKSVLVKVNRMNGDFSHHWVRVVCVKCSDLQIFRSSSVFVSKNTHVVEV